MLARGRRNGGARTLQSLDQEMNMGGLSTVRCLRRVSKTLIKVPSRLRKQKIKRRVFWASREVILARGKKKIEPLK